MVFKARLYRSGQPAKSGANKTMDTENWPIHCNVGKETFSDQFQIQKSFTSFGSFLKTKTLNTLICMHRTSLCLRVTYDRVIYKNYIKL